MAEVTTGLGKVAKEAGFLTRMGKRGVEYAGKFLSLGGHAQQEIPAQHRLFNVMMMVGGWWALDQVRDIMFGVNQVSEGEYVPVKREDVPAPLRFLHNAIQWDPYSEKPEDQWKGIVHKLLPAMGAGIGAVAGSMYAFERNGRAHEFRALSKNAKLDLMGADTVSQYAHAKPLRALTAFFGTFSSASGLTFLYGAFLNIAFAEANGARIFLGALKKGNSGPAKVLATHLADLGKKVKNSVGQEGHLDDAWAHDFVERGLKPLFGSDLKTPAQQEAAVKALQGVVKKAYDDCMSKHVAATDIAASIEDDLQKQLGRLELGKGVVVYPGLSAFLEKNLHLKAENATLGNANGAVSSILGGGKRQRDIKQKFLVNHAEMMAKDSGVPLR